MTHAVELELADILSRGGGAGACGAGAMAAKVRSAPADMAPFQVYWDCKKNSYAMNAGRVTAPSGVSHDVPAQQLESGKTYYCHVRYTYGDTPSLMTTVATDKSVDMPFDSGADPYVDYTVEIATTPKEGGKSPDDYVIDQKFTGTIIVGGGASANVVSVIDITGGDSVSGYSGTIAYGQSKKAQSPVFLSDVAYGYDLKRGTRIVAHRFDSDVIGGTEE